MQKKKFPDAFSSDRYWWIYIRPFPPHVQPIRTNGNQLHMRFFIGMHSAALIPLGLKRLGCHVDLYTVSRCRIRSESHTSKKVCKREIHPGFETQGIRHQKSKTEVSVAPRKRLMCPQKILKTKEESYASTSSS